METLNLLKNRVGYLGILLFSTLLLSSCADVKFKSKGVEGPKACAGAACPQAVSYKWFTGSYGLCNKPCGGGEQVRDVLCKREDGVVVADTYCKEAKPTSVQTCNIQACPAPTYNWNIGPYGSCSKTCGGGTQTRSVICQNNSGTNSADNLCPQPKPQTEQACNTQACDPNYTYAWDVGSYGSCSVLCGGGIQLRSVVCRRSDGVVVVDSFCSANPKPSTQQSCNTQSCTAYTYSWLMGTWSTCSKTCGSGIQTRSAACQRSDGAFVNESLCPTPKPSVQQACNTQICPPSTREVRTVKTVEAAQQQVDILMVFDDSGSMAVDNTKLASRMSGFLADLKTMNLDYQICVTATNVDYYQGKPIIWVGTGSHIMKPSTPNKAQVFSDTVDAIGSGYSSDEQAIKASNLAVSDNARTGCFRPKAALSIILISDEDERSVGGIQALSPAQYMPLGSLNYPDSLISNVASTFNTSSFKKPFTVNSIIVKPGDTTCEAQQDAQGDPSFPGRLYAELSTKTGGHIGSICDADYTQNLKYVKEQIYNSLPAITLECNPIGAPTVTISPSFSTTTTLIGNELKFNPAVPQGSTVTVDYVCPL